MVIQGGDNGVFDDETFKAAALDDAVNGLLDKHPLSSASVAFCPWQRNVLLALAAVTVVCGVLFLVPTLIVFTVVCTVGYVWTMIDRLLLFSRGLDGRTIVTISDDEALALTDDQLPHYTILVPAYNEPEVVGDLIEAMNRLDYPPDKLQVILLLEADDDATIGAARATHLGEVVTILLVPPLTPAPNPKPAITGCTSPPARSSPSTMPRIFRTRCNCAALSPRSTGYPAIPRVCRRNWASTTGPRTCSPPGSPPITRCGSGSSCRG